MWGFRALGPRGRGGEGRGAGDRVSASTRAFGFLFLDAFSV